ncbi:MAG: VanW family protein, partial [Clostridia bacterium]
ACDVEKKPSAGAEITRGEESGADAEITRGENADADADAEIMRDEKPSADAKITRRKKPSADAKIMPDAGRARGGARKGAPRKGRGRRKKQRVAWWSTPVAMVMTLILSAVVVFSIGALVRGTRFNQQVEAVSRDTFYPGITVDGQDVSTMTLAQALDTWRAKDAAARAACTVDLVVDGKKWSLSAEDMGYASDYETVLKSAYAIGRHGTFATRADEVTKTAGIWARDYRVVLGYDEEKLTQLLSQIATSVSEPAVNATISGFDEVAGFTYVEGKDGLVVDVGDMLDEVARVVQSGGGRAEVDRHKVAPGQTIATLQGHFGKISTCKTSATTSSSNRLANLNLACNTISGMAIQPGETFSYNQALGKRTREKGYKSAPALASGSHTFQVGGGICQVSTTLFNVVAKAGLEIVERYPHSLPSTYIGRGLDATVNWPNQDLKFKNTSDYPVYISAKLTKSKQVLVSLYGRLLDDGVEIKLKVKTNGSTYAGAPAYVYTNDLPTGATEWLEKRRTGYRTTTYRFYYKDGKETSREELCKSTYPSSGGIIKVGR